MRGQNNGRRKVLKKERLTAKHRIMFPLAFHSFFLEQTERQTLFSLSSSYAFLFLSIGATVAFFYSNLSFYPFLYQKRLEQYTKNLGPYLWKIPRQSSFNEMMPHTMPKRTAFLAHGSRERSGTRKAT
jgi:hypothetical protein